MTRMLYVTPPPYRDHMRRGWNPWSALRDRDHIRFVLDPVAEVGGGGLYARHGDCAAIVIHPELHRIDRRAALAHELIHDERGIVPTEAPQWIVSREEHLVHLEVARRLVPLDQLADFVEAHAGPLTVADVADEFDVPPDVARRAIDMIRGT
jgi:hypothetical protein